MAETNNAVTAETLMAVDHVECLAENLKEIGNVFKLGPAGEQAVATHARMPAIVRQAAQAAGEIFDRAVDAGQDQASRICSTTATSRSPIRGRRSSRRVSTISPIRPWRRCRRSC
jgi:methyl-accepting chemotaxis protein